MGSNSKSDELTGESAVKGFMDISYKLLQVHNEALDKIRELERKIDETTDEMNVLITKQRSSNDKLQFVQSLLEEDIRLHSRKEEFGRQILDAVIEALTDLQEHNSSGC